MSAMPDFVDPMLATLVAAPFDDPAWLFEVKWDGFRVEAVVRGDEVRLWTRGRKDAEGYFGPFLAPPTWVQATDAIVDGEVIALGADGEPDFSLLQERIRRRKVQRPALGDLVYQVFDLLWLDGRSLLPLPLEERKALLRGLLRPDPRVRFSDHVETHGIAFYEAARARGLEGMMAKVRNSPYLPGARSSTWQKVKIRPSRSSSSGAGTRAGAPPSTSAPSTSASMRATCCAMPARSAPASRGRRAPSCSKPSRRSRPRSRRSTRPRPGGSSPERRG